MLFLKEIRLFRALHDATQSAYPMGKTLRTFAAREKDAGLAAMAVEIESGRTVSESMRKRPELFPPWQTEIVAVGEESGRLDKSFAAIAESLEAARGFWLQLLPKLAYPLLVIHFAPFALHAPAFFSDGPAAYLLDVAGSLAPLYAAGAVAWGLALELRRRPGLLLHVPLAGGFLRERFARYLALLVESGLSYPRALELASRAAGLPEGHAGLRTALARCGAGGSARDSLKDLGLFTAEELDAIEAGEVSGKLDRELAHLALAVRERNQAALSTILYIAPALAILVAGLLLARKLVGFYGSSLDVSRYM